MTPETEQLLNNAVNTAVAFALGPLMGSDEVDMMEKQKSMIDAKSALVARINELEKPATPDGGTGNLLMSSGSWRDNE